jgi:hypothetical protein
MTPVNPPIYNQVFTAPGDMDASQVESIQAFVGEIPPGNNLDGASFVVVAWQPSQEELIELLQRGGPIYLSCLGTLPPHFLTTEFSIATYGTQK